MPDRAADREVPVGDGRRILIRHVRREDDVDLLTLYESLDDDDRYRRFFNSYRPSLDFFTDMATVGERGGARLVAVLGGPEVAHRIVGEAGYVLLPNGDGELGTVVAPQWRGWLGPYLLDDLVRTAAAAGVPNLEADVLAVDGPMLAVLRTRGSVVMEHVAWSVVRLLIGTTGATPTWPGHHDRPRVLVESAAGHWHAEDQARAAGLQLLTCPGPRNGRRSCPALEGEPCRLAAEADVVVVSHPPDDAAWRELFAAHAEVHPGVPVCLEPCRAPVAGQLDVMVCPAAKDAEVVSFVGQLNGPTTPHAD